MNAEEQKKRYLQRIDVLLEKLKDINSLAQANDRATVDACYMGTVNLVESLYGSGCPQIKSLIDAKKSFTITNNNFVIAAEIRTLAQILQGTLINAREELEQDLIRSIATEAVGAVIGDMVSLAKAELKAGYKDVAAILAAVALEDAMKRKADELGVNVEGKTLDSILNALKAKSFFKGAQVPIVSSYVKLRNSAMHADWGSIPEADVNSLIGFLEPFLLEHFK